MSAQKSKKFSLSDKVGMTRISKSNEGEFDESWLREEVSGEEEVLRMLEDGESEVGAKKIFPPFFSCFFGM